LPGSLARLYDTFSLEKCGVQRKPAFPHLWNKTKNLDKICRGLPPLKYYCVEKMKDDEAHEFMKWYKTNSTVGEFNLKNALIDYCSNDVQMLRSFFFSNKNLLVNQFYF
jgi:hypothetical protein